MATWQLDAYTHWHAGHALVQAALPFRRLRAARVPGGPGVLEADFGVWDDLGGVEPGIHELRLLEDGVVRFAGPLLDADVADPREDSVKFQAEGLLTWFREPGRLITSDLSYTAIAQEQIAWNLIAHTQAQANGDLGIVQGSHTGSSVTRDRDYCAGERPNVWDELEAFTSLDDGLDLEIDPATRAFNTWSPQRKPATGITLDGTKLDEISFVRSARDQVTYVSGIGEGKCKAYIYEASDAGVAATAGRKHVSLDASSNKTAEVDAEARELLRARKRARFDAHVSFRDNGPGVPAWTSLVPGGTLTLTDDRGYATYSKTLRIVEVAVNLEADAPTVAQIEVLLSSAVD